jgi:hypothetical protein
LGFHVRRRGVQPGADAKSAGQPGGCRVRHRRSMPACDASGQNEPQIQALIFSKRNLGVAFLLSGIMRGMDFSKTRRFSAAC